MSLTRRTALAGLALLGAGGAWWLANRGKGAARAKELYSTPLAAPDGPLNTYHLGHSLVGRTMPAMLAQLAGHGYASQLGWGTSLREHWEPDLPINGFDTENAHDRHLPAHKAVGSGSYDAVVLTEMVEIADAVRYHDTAEYLARWAGLAWESNPNARIYLYETWHHTNDPAGWLKRLDGDLDTFWQGQILYPALGKTSASIHLIPAGQVMAAFARRLNEAGGIGGIARIEDLFVTKDDGSKDTIHINDLGAYLVALTHYAVLYHRNPKDLPHVLKQADGTSALAPSAEAAAAMKETVWEVVGRYPQTGVRT